MQTENAFPGLEQTPESKNFKGTMSRDYLLHSLQKVIEKIHCFLLSIYARCGRILVCPFFDHQLRLMRNNEMADPYQTPRASLDVQNVENTSGMGKGVAIPEGVKGLSWPGFFLSWIWAAGNRTWIGLLALIPYVGFIMSFVLLFKGREWAWQNKRWESVEHFNRVQKQWSTAVLVIIGICFALGLLFGIAGGMSQ